MPYKKVFCEGELLSDSRCLLLPTRFSNTREGIYSFLDDIIQGFLWYLIDSCENMFGFVHCNASIIARQNTDPHLFFVRHLVKNWLWPIITFFGVTGNILAIIVLAKRRMIMPSTNNYLIALAIVDIAYLSLTLILNTLQHPCYTNTSLSDIVLTICRPIVDFSSNTSVWLTVTFTVERWVAITYPLRSRRWCTARRARKIILGVMCTALICTLPSAFEMKLVRIIERKNLSDQIVYTSYIKAKPTMLGDSLLYQKIYFNFVTFVIVWIPLLLLFIFNTILISYVRRSKREKQQNHGGVELRRHTRTSQSEQRKTTIMLIAVVLVFTVCQIPQAISLTLQSFVPSIARTPKVLIYNNFANCLVALNASTNFLLYCCFSQRFRSTIRLNFTFLRNCCGRYIQSKWQIKEINDHQSKHSISIDNISNNSLPGSQLYTRASDTSNSINVKYIVQMHQKLDGNKQSWFRRMLFSSSKFKQINHSKTVSIRRARTSNVSAGGGRTLIEASSRHSIKIENLFPERQSTSLQSVNHLTPKSILRPKSHSLTDNNNNQEQIWIKHHQSHSTIKHLLNQRRSYNAKEIIDVTV